VFDKPTSNTSQGVGEVKKPQSNGLASDVSYLNAKKRKMEILIERRDGDGNRYLALFDPGEPCVDIRLYPCKQDEILFQMGGSDIIGDIASFEHTDRKALRGYYKVSPWTVKFETGEPDEPTIMDHRGKLIPVSEWETQYSVCGWCSSPLNFLEKNRYTTTGDCLCSGCAKDPEVVQYVNLV
jgi:hypothetical protein